MLEQEGAGLDEAGGQGSRQTRQAAAEVARTWLSIAPNLCTKN
jgi:hypothetical protein